MSVILLMYVLLMAIPLQAQDTSHRVNLPLVLKSFTGPKASASYYILQLSNLPLFQLKGCISAVDLQEKDIDFGFISFFFFAPAYQQGRPNESGRYGTKPPSRDFISIDEIKDAVKLWMRGFMEGFHEPDLPYECDLHSDRKMKRTRVILALATTNEPLSFELPKIQMGIIPGELLGVSLEGHGRA